MFNMKDNINRGCDGTIITQVSYDYYPISD